MFARKVGDGGHRSREKPGSSLSEPREISSAFLLLPILQDAAHHLARGSDVVGELLVGSDDDAGPLDRGAGRAMLDQPLGEALVDAPEGDFLDELRVTSAIRREYCSRM